MAGKTYNFNGLAEARMNKAVVAIIKSLFAFLSQQPWAQSIWPGSGWRTGSAEHSSGRAVDIMVSSGVNRRPTPEQKKAADALVNLLIKHAKALGIQWVLFGKDGQVTWSYNVDRGNWRRLSNRGSVSANHIDHVHVYFKSSARLPQGFVWGSVAALPQPPVSTNPSTAPKLVDTVSVKDLKAARYADPPKKGTPKGPYADQVWTLETALVKTGWMLPEHKDGHYGVATLGDGSAGYGGTTGFQVKHSGVTKAKADGWLGTNELNLLFKLANMRVKVTA